nr:uncharacterized protein LOC116283528 [Vicugna pacos]
MGLTEGRGSRPTPPSLSLATRPSDPRTLGPSEQELVLLRAVRTCEPTQEASPIQQEFPAPPLEPVTETRLLQPSRGPQPASEPPGEAAARSPVRHEPTAPALELKLEFKLVTGKPSHLGLPVIPAATTEAGRRTAAADVQGNPASLPSHLRRSRYSLHGIGLQQFQVQLRALAQDPTLPRRVGAQASRLQRRECPGPSPPTPVSGGEGYRDLPFGDTMAWARGQRLPQLTLRHCEEDSPKGLKRKTRRHLWSFWTELPQGFTQHLPTAGAAWGPPV